LRLELRPDETALVGDDKNRVCHRRSDRPSRRRSPSSPDVEREERRDEKRSAARWRAVATSATTERSATQRPRARLDRQSGGERSHERLHGLTAQSNGISRRLASSRWGWRKSWMAARASCGKGFFDMVQCDVLRTIVDISRGNRPAAGRAGRASSTRLDRMSWGSDARHFRCGGPGLPPRECLSRVRGTSICRAVARTRLSL
jgi:hypothetical protein